MEEYTTKSKFCYFEVIKSTDEKELTTFNKVGCILGIAEQYGEWFYQVDIYELSEGYYLKESEIQSLGYCDVEMYRWYTSPDIPTVKVSKDGELIE